MSMLDSEVAHAILHSYLERLATSRPEPTVACKLPFDHTNYPMMEVSLTELSFAQGQALLDSGLEDIKTPWWDVQGAASSASASGGD